MQNQEEHIERLFNELKNEDSLLWYANSKYGKKIILKIPSTAIKSIYKGCKVEFLFGKDANSEKSYFHIGATVFDFPNNGFNVVSTHKFKEEHWALFEIMKDEKIPIEFYNELGYCFMQGFVNFGFHDRQLVLNLLGDIENLYSGEIDQKSNSSLDSFEYTLDPVRTFNNVNLIDTLKIEGHFSDLVPLKNHFVGLHEGNEIHIDDSDEGASFEKQIWILFDNLFEFNLHKNPKIFKNGKEREFTDILAFYEFGIFLIETKAMAVITLEGTQTTERKVANVQKQISKAITQLVGAKKTLEKNLSIFDIKKNEIKFNKEIIPHCIVIVNELVPFGEWKAIEQEIENAILNENIYLNVFEFMEFMKFIKGSSGQKELLDYLLMERTKTFLRHKSVFIKSDFSNQELYKKVE